MDTTFKSVGGFFELELPRKGSLYHDFALALANGRVCFRVLLEHTRPNKVYVPYYCCDMLIQPLKDLGIAFEFYAINELFEPIETPHPRKNELFVYVNYFGLKANASRRLSRILGDLLVLDNTQAFFEKSYGATWSFNSGRKFFGVPDGGFLYAPVYLEDAYTPNQPVVTEHLWQALSGQHQEAYASYQESEAQQTTLQSGMSELTKRILYGVDFINIARIRKRNYRQIDRALRHKNLMPAAVLDANPTAVPFCYPLLLDKPIEKTLLYEKRIFIPTFWMEMLTRDTEGYDFEKSLVHKLLLLPIDHRVEESDLRRMVDTILAL